MLGGETWFKYSQNFLIVNTLEFLWFFFLFVCFFAVHKTKPAMLGMLMPNFARPEVRIWLREIV